MLSIDQQIEWTLAQVSTECWITMGNYRFVAIETYRNSGEPSCNEVRARPLPGQGLSTDMKVECSRKVRIEHPIGTVFIIRAQITDREGGAPFLYSSWQWAYEVVPRAEAEARISSGELR